MSTHPSGGQQPSSPRTNLHAVPHLEEQGAPARLRRNIIRIMGGRRPRRRPAMRSLVIEQLIIGGQRAARTISYAESVVGSLGKAAGDRALRVTQRALDSLARKSDRLRAEQVGLRIRADYRDGDLVPHPDGGVQTVTETSGDQEKLRKLIATDTENGSRKHRRLPQSLRHVPPLVFTADALLLLYFFSGITNVDWARPFSAALLFAVLLAGMVTGISFAFFRFTGDRLQQYKDGTGTIPLRGLDAATNISMGMAVGAMVILASLMFLRMHTEVTQTLGPQSATTAFVIGLTVALVSVLANSLVVAVHALDGSPEADRLEALGQAVYGPLTLQHQLREHADTLDHEIAVIGREAERAAAKGITAAGYERAEYDRIIDAARAIHQGTGPESESAVNPNDADGVIGYRRTEATPEVDERPLHLTLEHIHTPLGDESPQRYASAQEPDGDQEHPAA
jgi:hypothetical protein